MNEGERQVSPTLDGIRRDHLARYEFVAKRLKKDSRVIDFGCGVGYGSSIMAATGAVVSGFDIDTEAIDYAKTHYAQTGAKFALANGNVTQTFGTYDVAVAFEIIEHIEDPRPLLKALRLSAPTLYCSVPNESVAPWEQMPGVGTLYHFRHYTKWQFKALLEECGWAVTEWHGQESWESPVEENVNGRTLVAVCVREAVEIKEPDQPEGKHVAILGLGPSLDQYVDICKRLGGRSKFCDETWVINALGNVIDCDLVFHMDDVRIQEKRAAAAPESNIASMLKWMKTSKVPIVTSRPHDDYPALVAFPLQDVLNNLQHDYFNSTAAYAVAFAIHTGATKLSLFGMDFTYANSHQAEKGRACVEFWLGQAQARGIKLSMPKTTTLMDAMSERKDRLYGYDTLDVVFDIKADGSLTLEFKELEVTPTAEEMEERYDHSAHPNALVASGK